MDWQEGFLVPPGDIKTLANKLGRIISDFQLQIKMGVLGRKSSMTLMTIDRSLEQFYNIVAIL